MDSSAYQNLRPVKLFHSTYCPPDTDYENRSPVILVHGMGATSATWGDVKEEIGKLTKRKIICIDLRNHGKSEWPDEVSMNHFIIDLENFMTEQNIPKAICLGNSLGGRVVLGLSFRRPDLVEKLILEDTFLYITSGWQTVFEKMVGVAAIVRKLPRTMSEEDAHNLIWDYCGKMFPDELKSFREKKNLPIPFYKDKNTGQFKCNIDLDAHSKLGNTENTEIDVSNSPVYEGRTLIMNAEKSNFRQEGDAEKLRKHLPNSQEVCIINGFHILHQENRQQFVKEVTNFINED